jgi:hypothetical protein
MEQTDDYALGEATEYEGRPLKPAALCPDCKQVKPLSEFKRRITGGEARAWGYANRFRAEIETAKCKSCRAPRTKPVQRMTAKEMQTRVVNDDLSVFTMQTELARRKEEATAAMKIGAANSYTAKVKKRWEPILEGMTKELATVFQQLKYAKTQEDAEMVAFFTAYKDALQMTRNQIKYHYIRVKPTMPDKAKTDWRQHVTLDTWKSVFNAWDALPLNKRAKRKLPALVNYHPPEPEAKTTASEPTN